MRLRVVAFNTTEQSSRDVSEDNARAVAERARHAPVPRGILGRGPRFRPRCHDRARQIYRATCRRPDKDDDHFERCPGCGRWVDSTTPGRYRIRLTTGRSTGTRKSAFDPYAPRVGARQGFFTAAKRANVTLSKGRENEVTTYFASKAA
jgi:hypothetical protein